MRLSVLSSGSSGNATYIESESGGLLVDAGLSCRRIRNLLSSIGRTLEDVGAVLLTHGHSDHTSGIRSLKRELGLPVFSAPGVGEGLGATIVEAGTSLEVCGMSARFFEVPHDADTYGLRLTDGEKAVALATDLGVVTEGVIRAMRGAEAVVLESNHDPEWLGRGPYSVDLKRRIASPNGHLSNQQAAEAAVALAPHGLQDLILAHLSKTNNSPSRARGTVHSALREAGYAEVRVRAALAGRPTSIMDVGLRPESPEYVYHYGEGQQLFEVD